MLQDSAPDPNKKYEIPLKMLPANNTAFLNFLRIFRILGTAQPSNTVHFLNRAEPIKRGKENHGSRKRYESSSRFKIKGFRFFLMNSDRFDPAGPA